MSDPFSTPGAAATPATAPATVPAAAATSSPSPVPSVAPHGAPRLRGRIRLVRPTYGFLVDEHNIDRFFHRNHTHYADNQPLPPDCDLTTAVFPGLAVEFTPVLHSSKGARAIFVRVLDAL